MNIHLFYPLSYLVKLRLREEQKMKNRVWVGKYWRDCSESGQHIIMKTVALMSLEQRGNHHQTHY